jgi:hypothetical protein
MTKTRAELQTQLDELAKQTPSFVRDHPDDGDFWSTFAGASDFIVDDAGADDYDWVLRQIDKILETNGRMPKELAPSDDLPPA